MIDPRRADALSFYDAEVARLSAHLQKLDDAVWSSPSRCPGWSVKDVLSHLAAGEAYNQACLDDRLEKVDFSGGGIDAWNARAVRQRRDATPQEVLAEWARRQADVRARWGTLGMGAEIPTSVGPYPLRHQVWHLAEEYAHHSDDVGVPIPQGAREPRARWRTSFLVFAAEEEGRPLRARLEADVILLRRKGTTERLDFEAFVAYATNRPWLMTDDRRRKLVERLLSSE